MKFNSGDKVSFINEKQDGTVVKTLSNGKVIVSIEDGFDIEVFEKELVLTGKSFAKQETATQPEKEVSFIPEITEVMQLCPESTICFAVIPAGIGAVLTGKVKYLIINNSGSEILFTCYSNSKNQWKGISSGIISSGTYFELLEIKREELVEISSFMIQGLFYNEKTLPGSGQFKKEVSMMLPDLQTFNKELKGVTSYAKAATIYSEAILEEIDVKDLLEKYDTPEVKKQTSPPTVRKAITNYAGRGILLNEKEIDLHIEELTKDFSGLSNSDLVQIQLTAFHKEMNYAMMNHYKKIVFIHGVGNGRLKQAIRNELRQYPGTAFRDADHSRFGYGATEVIFV